MRETSLPPDDTENVATWGWTLQSEVLEWGLEDTKTFQTSLSDSINCSNISHFSHMINNIMTVSFVVLYVYVCCYTICVPVFICFRGYDTA